MGNPGDTPPDPRPAAAKMIHHPCLAGKNLEVPSRMFGPVPSSRLPDAWRTLLRRGGAIGGSLCGADHGRLDDELALHDVGVDVALEVVSAGVFRGGELVNQKGRAGEERAFKQGIC
jgi:hypothetical protein